MGNIQSAGTEVSRGTSPFISADSDFTVSSSVSSSAAFSIPSRIPASPLQFHPQHGEHVEISPDGSVARRVRSYCKGTGAFSTFCMVLETLLRYEFALIEIWPLIDTELVISLI